ncbi:MULTISPECIES: N-acetyltransferase [unclassified Pseudomonas]|uniref:GNAT family N-acetyltransferase n=1 Tax=unclassified Pseudomonas TaxID=196821 RepID=UPI0015B616BF|nr:MULTISPECIES: GNAT family N-acetyltransferase [unclassified Pseudomonas]
MRLRKAEYRDLDSISDVHIKSFPGFFLTLLGKRFLKEMYAGFLKFKSGVCIVLLSEQGDVIGFAAGATTPEIFFPKLRRKRALYFAIFALPALLRNSELVIKKLWAAVFYRGDRPDSLQGGALLSSIGIDPLFKGQSLGKKLLDVFEDEAYAAGSPFVYLTTDQHGNDSVIGFYKKNGYDIESFFTQPGGRKMLRFMKIIKAS